MEDVLVSTAENLQQFIHSMPSAVVDTTCGIIQYIHPIVSNFDNLFGQQVQNMTTKYTQTTEGPQMHHSRPHCVRPQ